MKYIVKTEVEPLTISLKGTYKIINRGLYDKKFLKLEAEPKIEKIFLVIRNKVN